MLFLQPSVKVHVNNVANYEVHVNHVANYVVEFLGPDTKDNTGCWSTALGRIRSNETELQVLELLAIMLKKF